MSLIRLIFFGTIIINLSSCKSSTHVNQEIESNLEIKNTNEISTEEKELFVDFLNKRFEKCDTSIMKNISGSYKDVITYELSNADPYNTFCIIKNHDSLYLYPPKIDCKSIFNKTSFILNKSAALNKATEKGFTPLNSSIIYLGFVDNFILQQFELPQ